MKNASQSLASGVRGYALALLLVAVSTLVGLLIAPRWGSGPVDLLYLPAVLGVAILAGFGPAILAAVASALAYNFFFTAPYRTLIIHSPADVVTVIVLFLVALVASHLAAAIRAQANLASAHADRNATIAGFARRLLGASGEDELAGIAATELARLFECNAIVLAGGDLNTLASSPPTLSLTPSDRAVAALVFATGVATGRGLAPAMAVEWQFFPVRSADATVAVVGLARDDGLPAVDPDRRELVDSLLDQVALALERARLEQEARAFTSVRERDRVRSTLLSAIGQDLSPALGVITDAANDLRRSGQGDKALLALIGNEAGKLRRYLDNLVEMTPEDEQAPVEAGGVRIDLFHRAVTRDGEPVHLTPKEFAVLAELAKHPGRVLAHAHLLRAAWGPAHEKQSEYLRVAVRGLRQKLEADPKASRLILNVPSVGYRLNLER